MKYRKYEERERSEFKCDMRKEENISCDMFISEMDHRALMD